MSSLLWKYYKKSEELAKCEICSKSIGCKNGNTSGLKKHLGVHKDAYEEYALAQAETDRLNEKGNKREMEDNVRMFELICISHLYPTFFCTRPKHNTRRCQTYPPPSKKVYQI